jgi:hypothetical protein
MRTTQLVVTTIAMAAAFGMAAPPATAASMPPGAVDAMSARPAPSLPLMPPLNGATPPRFERANWASATLRAHGLRDIRGLARVGDYWEASAVERGRRVVVYLLSDGALDIRPATREAVARAFGGAG